MITNSKYAITEKGFTLIEMMMVLFIITAATGIALVSFQSLHESRQTEHFLEQLKKDLYLAQEYAMSHNKKVHLTFSHADHLYTIKAQWRDSPILTNNYDNSIAVKNDYNMGLIVTFVKGSGNISKIGKLKIQTPQGVYLIVFHPGKGRFYIEEQ